jgi:hypothetical protein
LLFKLKSKHIMKRSSIFLGLTTVCLAIAGVAAAKANNFGSTTGFYTVSGTCISTGVNSGCLYSATGIKTCRTTVAEIQTYYTTNSCQHILKYSDQ